MRLTVTIDDALMAEALKATGLKSKRAAVGITVTVELR
ncbi:hypothetical protein EIB18_15805 [Caulobacter vibrioides]|uniref:Uncharacterized protein n=2 Tax=Caulobacter vibrioides TaxID=155892 RepID=Q9A460_CAUVC|nr:type II toxin-antitoxin system VapB family antitoxin [Caulobacter vibrioides]YP_002518451.1 Arc/MetJ-family transcriptional regulator [Caulobacter vibrioides NA1000]AAK24945.1 hypothetical protein CC_2983 [Caulobacter vibrioides CB15]ACL96543.1 Arc/MetJ-family transcriptional regulator [Caulobacter vibrioides NA1000]ATC29816.1 hypothetical protein CA607_16065 [Caulobacter vibrioides]AZH14022.1 hypothetical protein EIB18_15805 [Caulobacter vibrioides]QXZ51332.1 type II toxin-antitoxin syste